jgi:4-alpha-glucanotransferase
MYGIGDFGPEAYKFADFLVRARQNYWQVLPLNMPILTQNSCSPYNGLSAFAGNTMLISPELLYRQGLLTRNDIRNRPAFPKARVNHNLAASYKTKLFSAAFRHFKIVSKKPDYASFCSKNKCWLDDYATFIALSRHFRGRLWCNWPTEFRDKNTHALKSIKTQLHEIIEQEKFLQYLFFRQWFGLKHYCNRLGISIIGDIPIYVAYDSADLWTHPEIFKLTAAKKPRFISGVPPDYFSRAGQLWSNPIYNWRALKDTGYSWWIQRIQHNLTMFDIVRLDHFRGFIAYWQVPAGSKTARNGKWIKGPKEDFFNILFKRFPPSSFIVEDLGYITADVREVIDKFRLRGMRVLQFGFGEDSAENPHCLDNHVENSVVYTGTHDNNTIRGWFEKEAKPEQKTRLSDYLGRRVPAAQVHWELIRLAMSSIGSLVIIPMQDVLGLGEQARMNRPAMIKGNWSWRLASGQTTQKITRKMARLTEIYARA